MRWRVNGLLLAAGLMSGSMAVAAEITLVGNVSKITTEFVEIEGRIFPLRNGTSKNMRGSSREATECWAGARTTCGTLAGVGYIDKARVIVRDGVAVHIEVVEMRQ